MKYLFRYNYGKDGFQCFRENSGSSDSVFIIEPLEKKEDPVSVPEKRIGSFPSRRHTVDSGLGLDSIAVFNDATRKNLLKLKTRRKSIVAKAKEKKVVSILLVITTMFTIVNIPSAICRIMIDNDVNQKWFRVSNLFESLKLFDS